MSKSKVLVRAATVAALVAVSALPAAAQAWVYPAFQPPRTTTREFNFGLASADDAGTSLLFQWREGMSPKGQLSADIGFADADGGSAFFLGGQDAHQLAVANTTTPLDFLLTIGAGFASFSPEADGADNTNFFRIPVGVVIGKRFPLEGAMSLTPYAHPRFVIENCGKCGPDGDGENEFGIEFDIGADFTFTPTIGMRFGARMIGTDLSDDDAFGISLAWTPGRTR